MDEDILQIVAITGFLWLFTLTKLSHNLPHDEFSICRNSKQSHKQILLSNERHSNEHVLTLMTVTYVVIMFLQAEAIDAYASVRNR